MKLSECRQREAQRKSREREGETLQLCWLGRAFGRRADQRNILRHDAGAVVRRRRGEDAGRPDDATPPEFAECAGVWRNERFVVLRVDVGPSKHDEDDDQRVLGGRLPRGEMSGRRSFALTIQ